MFVHAEWLGLAAGVVCSLVRVVVVGAGAIGAGLGGLLHRAGVEVVLVARGTHAAAMRDRGLLLRTPAGQHRLDVEVAELDELELRATDQIWVAVKLNDAEALYRRLRVPDGATVLSLQNGMAADPWLAPFAGARTSMVWFPAELLVPGRVDLHGVPCGAVDIDDAVTAGLLQRAGVRCTVRADLDAWRRAKWITNLCGAAVSWGEESWVEELMAEGRAVFEAAGVPVVSESELMAYVGDIGVQPIDGAERLRGGSTAQSLARGRPLEVRWLNGPIVALARRVGVPVPRNEAVLERAGLMG